MSPAEVAPALNDSDGRDPGAPAPPHHEPLGDSLRNSHALAGGGVPAAPMNGDPLPDYRARVAAETATLLASRERERAEQSSEMHSPAERIRLWERLHQMSLPLDANHPVLRVIASSTRLSLDQVRDEQKRRAERE